tara:strand:+ start:870 stop:3317 length:2448 start_codon:yes stop_codon:yes gene_type:complete
MVVAISGINIGLTIHGAVDPKLGNKIFPSGENIDFGYWRGYKNDSLTSKSGIFNEVYIPFDGTGVKRTNKPEVFDKVNSTNIIVSGNSHWERAGSDNIGDGSLAYVERSIYLNPDDYIIAGSGKGLGYTNKFSIYAKLSPSGSQLNRRIVSKHKENPAQMVLGTDSDGLYYIRADGLDDDGDNVAYQVKSDKDYSLYDYPTQVVGVFGYSSEGVGDATKNSLALYVNGELQDEISARFNRNSPEDRRADNIIIGNPEFAGTDGYRGWIDEVGIANYAISPSSVQRLYDNTFSLSSFVNQSMGTSGAYNFSFSSAFDSMDTNYIEFIVESGTSQGQVGGAFDKTLWGNNEYSVSSQIYFNMDSIRQDTYQVTDNVYVDMWVKHDTNHFSGAYLQPYISLARQADTAFDNLHWKGPTVFLPSSVKKFQNIRFSGALDHLHPYSGGNNVFHQDGKKEFRSDFNLHELNISLSYPSGTSASTEAQFRRNKPFESSFRVYSAKVNVDAFVIPSTGTEELDLYTSGDTASSKTANIDLYIESSEVVGSIDLYLQNNKTNIQASGFLSVAPLVSTNKDATLFTKAGVSDDLKLNSLNLMIREATEPTTISSDIDLFVDGSQFGRSGIRNYIDLFLDVADPIPAASGFFVKDGSTTLFHKGASRALIGAKPNEDRFGPFVVNDPSNPISDFSSSVNQFSRPLYTHGEGTTGTDVGTSSTHGSTSNSINIFINNLFRSRTNNIPLYAKTVSSVTKSGTLNLFMSRASGQLNQTELFLRGPDPSGTISLFNLGHTVKSSSISLYASGLGTLTNSTTPLVTKGYTS